MIDASVLRDLTHPDELQRMLAVTFASALHAHVCMSCGQLCICTVMPCEWRRDQRKSYECFRCADKRKARAQATAEAAADALGCAEAAVDRAMQGED